MPSGDVFTKIGPAIGWNLAITEKTPRAAVNWILNVLSGHFDFLRWDLTVANLLSVVGQSWRLIGAKIEMDLGDGVLSTITAAQLGSNITLSGSINGFGARQLTFSRYGADQSPMQSTLLRGMRQVRMTGYRGVAGTIGSRVMFDGYVRDASFAAFPPLAQFDCQDASLAYADTPIAFNLEPGSLKTRADVIIGILATAGIPAGVFETPSGSGIVFKAISEAGDKRVLDWLKQFIEPIGATGYWRTGKFNFKRFDTTGPVVRTLTGGDINNISIDPPPTNTPNAVQVSSTLFSYMGPTGTRTEVSDVTSSGFYTPVVAVTRQNSATGVQTASGLTSSSVIRPVSRKVITTSFQGGSVVYQTIDEYGWYAPKACRARLGGGTTYNNQFDVWQFPDGSWRTTAQEDFQLIRRVSVSRAFGTDNYLGVETVAISEYHAVEIPFASLSFATGTEVAIDVLATDEGIAWSGGKESLVSETNWVGYYKYPDFHLFATQAIVYGTQAEYFPSNNPGAAYSGLLRYVFGPAASKRYGTVSSALGSTFELFRWLDSYVPIGESLYRIDTTRVVNSSFPPSFQGVLAVGSRTVAGPVPFVEQLTAFQAAQPATVSVSDDLRKSLSLSRAIKDFRQNDYCETPGEMQTVAVEALRAISAPVVLIDMDIDWIIQEGDVIAVNHPALGYGIVKLLVTGITWTLNGMGRNSQRLTCRWYTPELAAAA